MFLSNAPALYLTADMLPNLLAHMACPALRVMNAFGVARYALQ